MLHSSVSGSIAPLQGYDISKSGYRNSPLELPKHQLSIQNGERWWKTKIRSCDKPITKARVVKTRSLPLAIESNFTNDDDDKLSSFFNYMAKLLDAFYRFSRPHTIIGTLIGVTSVSLLPLQSISDLSHKFFVGWFKDLLLLFMVVIINMRLLIGQEDKDVLHRRKTLVPAILMNIYVVGLNQLFDIEIDKVNKPNLPLASGEITIGVGSTIVLTCCIISFAVGFASQSPPLIMALLICFSLGSAYSLDLPFLRWKKQPFLAALSIVIVRAVTLQVAFFMHVQKYVLGRAIALTRPVMFATSFMCFFVTVIALFKDIPDIDGDKHFGVQSFSISLGKEKVFWLCVKLLLAAYGSAVAVGMIFSSSPVNIIPILGHSVLASILWNRAQTVDLADNVSITSFYMFIWKLFYAEYLLIPFIR